MTIPNTCDIGDIRTLTCRFYSDAAMTTPAAPTAVTLTIRDPYGAILTPGIPPAAVATYDYAPLVGGMHEIRWVGTGAVAAADQEQLFVRKVNTA